MCKRVVKHVCKKRLSLVNVSLFMEGHYYFSYGPKISMLRPVLSNKHKHSMSSDGKLPRSHCNRLKVIYEKESNLHSHGPGPW